MAGISLDLISTSNDYAQLLMPLMRKPFYLLSILSCFAAFSLAQADSSLSPLTAAEADAIIADRVALKKQAEAEHIANSVAFSVLERREVDLGGRKLIANRVADPKLPKIKKAKKTSTGTTSNNVPPEFFNSTAKEQHTLAISATIHEGEPTVTQLKWRGSDGTQFEAWSNIDWKLMRGIMTLSSETDEYLIFQGIGVPSHDDEVPALPPFTEGRAEYFVFADSTTQIDEDAFEGIDLLHSYFDANEAELKIRYQREVALNEARERHKALNPEKPKNAVVHFWKSEEDN